MIYAYLLKRIFFDRLKKSFSMLFSVVLYQVNILMQRQRVRVGILLLLQPHVQELKYTLTGRP